ncbi:MAG TPA: chemotaxis protein CheA [Spirochaetia bacterium]|jgi:two-component system chemotaxis sensor kinase CheA|nr:chemotaxis protein CheA [Spirochaetia bacterium]
MNFDQSKGLFLEEARDLLTRAEASLLLLEGHPEDMDQVNEVFRALHTIKGSGAMFGFTAVSEFTHRIESLFDEVRKGRLPATTDVVEIGLQAADHIGRLLEDRGDPAVADQIFQGIDHLGLGEAAPASFAPVTRSAPAVEAPQTGESRYQVVFRPRPEILHRGVKIEPLFAELADLGQLGITADAGAVPDLEALDPTSLYLTWTLILTTEATLAEVRQVFLFVEDYSELTITPAPAIASPVTASGPPAPAPEREPVVAPAKKPGPPAGSPPVPRAAESDSKQESATIRVRKDKLDTLIDTVGELVILQARLEREAQNSPDGNLSAISETLGRLTADLRDTTMSIRMVPLDELFTGYQRLVRDLARSLAKEVSLEVTGASTELDKNIIESLKDPLLHIIRNSADHGIEAPDAREAAGKPRKGTISLGARQAGSRVEIAVSDDGAGLNLEKIKARAVAHGLLASSETNEDRIRSMIFEPGFSTAETTTAVSGRGVGMDVVKKNVEKLRGEVVLSSTRGRGTTITLSIPLTLVIIDGLLVRLAGVDYILPLGSVEECVDMTADFADQYHRQRIIHLRGRTIPVVDLRQVLGHRGTFEGVSRLAIVTVEGMTVGLLVDSVVGKQQVVIKPLSSVRNILAVSGATILGDGSVALILDLGEIVKSRIGKESVQTEGT